MVGFELSDEQKELQALAREFARKEILPRAKHHDQTGEYPWEIIRKAHAVGLMNPHIPEQYGGLALGSFEAVLLAEELSAGCAGISSAMGVNSIAEAPVILAGSDEQKRRFLAPLTEEPLMVAYCVTEPGAGSDVAGIRTTARLVGDEYVIDGEKMWITNGGTAIWYFVLAYTDRDKGHKGMSAFIVPREADGVAPGKKEPNMGQRASDTRAVTFREVRVPAANLLGREGDGFKIAMAAFDHSRPHVAASALGVARACMEHAVRYAGERQAFGVPIAQHQAVQFLIADMAKDIEAGRLLAWHAAWLVDQGARNTHIASMAKLHCADTATRVSSDALQIFGGYGYSEEYPVEKLYRDAKIFQIYEGTSQIQRLIIARNVLQARSEPVRT